MNRVLKLLTIYDILVLGGFELLSPIFAIYINDNIIGGSIFAAGATITIYALVKATVQIPISKYTDREKGNSREFNVLLIGSLITALVPLLYVFADTIMEIYLVQIILGIGAGLCYPGWMTIFTRFTEKGEEGYDWSFYNTCITFVTAIAAIVGGFMAQNFGFKSVFMLLFVFACVSVVLIAKMHKYVTKHC